MTRNEELAAIRAYIDERGVHKIVPSDYLKYIGYTPPQYSRTKRADWHRGQKKSPRWRYNLALSYAKNNELEAPAWTDVLEGQLEALCALGFSYRQIAKVMGKSKNAIQARVRYLRLGRRLYRQ